MKQKYQDTYLRCIVGKILLFAIQFDNIYIYIYEVSTIWIKCGSIAIDGDAAHEKGDIHNGFFCSETRIGYNNTE